MELFDITETRRSLLARRMELLAESEANSKIQDRFNQISQQLKHSSSSSGTETTQISSDNESQEFDSLEENISHIQDTVSNNNQEPFRSSQRGRKSNYDGERYQDNNNQNNYPHQ
jgi:Na+/phosphate symporter